MNAEWIVAAVAAVVAAGLGWRYFRLVRALAKYEGALRSRAPSTEAQTQELKSLAHTVRQLLTVREDQLSQSISERDRLAAVLDQLTDGVMIADAAGEVRYSNPAAARIFQVPSAVDRSVTEVLRDHRLVDAWRLSAESRGMHSASVEVPTRHQFLQLVVVPDVHGGGTLLLVQDLTRMRRLETVRQDFVSNFSHELRTPLASLRALAETLLDGALRDPEAAPRFLQRIIGEVDSLTQMSQELLDLTAIEAGNAALELAPTDARTLLLVVADRMRLQAERAGLALEVDCPEGIPSVRGDGARLGQVLLNLIHNAVKFTPPGGKITLSAAALEPVRGSEAPPERVVQFSVTDTGQGVAAEDLPRIFERFYRADRARTKGGTGMGLSIARHLVEAHGGRIWAESVEGQGSVFRFTVPQTDQA